MNVNLNNLDFFPRLSGYVIDKVWTGKWDRIFDFAGVSRVSIHAASGSLNWLRSYLQIEIPPRIGLNKDEK
tara:strand:- start:14 stop:226 length:213 start_codon:yes stop_codon:yes gene_type:complete